MPAIPGHAVTHHSSSRFNLTVGFRSSVLEPLYRFVYFIPLALAGFRPVDIAFIYSVTQVWDILVHTERVGKLGWLEYMFVTPSYYRVHHGSTPRYLDKNMGMFLIIWDKLFGTFQPELPPGSYQPVRYGLTQPLMRETPATIAFHERDSPCHDLNKPGWSPDGSPMTSRQLRRKEEEMNSR